MKKYYHKLLKWVKNNKREFFLLTGVLALALILRIWRIGEYMTFLGDEGRDMIIVRRLLVHGDLILIGPGTSIGNMFLGPLYYYLIAPPLLLFNFSPVGPAVFVAVLGVATVYLIWFVGREWFSKEAGLIAAFLYAISPTTIIFSRSSWNPNVMPFFAMLSIYAISRVYEKGDYKWLAILGGALAFALQSHYLGLLLLPVIGIFWLLRGYKAWRGKTEMREFIRYSLALVLIFAFLMSPLVIFDLRHGYINYNAMREFFGMRQTSALGSPLDAIPGVWPLLVQLSSRLVAGREEMVGRWVALGILGTALIFLKDTKRREFLILFVWLGVSLLGLGLLNQQIYDHYFGFLFPAPFLIVGGGLGYLIDKARLRGIWIALTAMVFLVYFNILNSPLLPPPNRQMDRAQAVADLISREVGEEKFNLAVIAERNYEDGYQYFLERDGRGVVDIDAQRVDETIKDKLYVVCEFSEKEKCDPTHNPRAEVANFGWSVIEQEWEVFGVHVFRLGHSQ